MNKHLSKAVDNLVDRIDALVTLRISEPTAHHDVVEYTRIALTDAITDLIAAIKEDN